MAEMRYEVRARRAGKWWALDVPAVPGVFSQTRRLDQAEEMAIDAIATALDVAPAGIEVTVEVEAPADLRASVADVRAKRALAEEYRAAASASTRSVVAEAQRQGFTVRDIAALLGISFQQVSKLSGPPEGVPSLEAKRSAKRAAKPVAAERTPERSPSKKRGAPSSTGGGMTAARKVAASGRAKTTRTSNTGRLVTKTHAPVAAKNGAGKRPPR